MGWVGRHWRWIAGSLVAATTIALLAPIDYRDRDFAGFWFGSRMLLDGRDPYDPAIWLPAVRASAPYLGFVAPPGTGFGYPLWTAILGIPFALVPFEVASRLWLGSQTFLGLIGFGALLSTIGPAGRPRHVVLLTALLVTSQSASMLEEVANIQGFMFAVVSGGLALELSGHSFASGAVLGLLFVKPQLALFLPVLPAVAPGRRRLAAGVALTAALLLFTSLLARPGWIPQWGATLGGVHTGIGPRATAWGLGPLVGVAGVVPAALAVGAYAVWWRLARPSQPMLFAAAVAVSLFVTPYAGRHDALLLYAPLAIAASALAGAPLAARAMGLGLIVFVGSPLPWFLHILVLGHWSEAIGAIVPLAVFGVIVECERFSHASTAAVE